VTTSTSEPTAESPQAGSPGDPPFFSVVLNQRAHRYLRPDPVPDALVEQVLTAATHAPSGENCQPWVFVVVRDADVKRTVGRLVAENWTSSGSERTAKLVPGWLHSEVDHWAQEGLATAPVHIVVCADERLCHPGLWPSSIFPAVQNLLLAAAALGLGSLMSTYPVMFAAQLREMLGLPEHVHPQALIPLGFPAKQLGPPRRIPMQDKTFRERYGEPW
jgi:nitroreductase